MVTTHLTTIKRMWANKIRDTKLMGDQWKWFKLLSAHLCRSSGVGSHDCLSTCFSVQCELWFEMVFFHIAPYSVHPHQSGPSSRYLSHRHRCYLLCNIRVFSSHYMGIQRKAFLSDICGDWLDHCIAPELFISDSVFPCLALNPS